MSLRVESGIPPFRGKYDARPMAVVTETLAALALPCTLAWGTAELLFRSNAFKGTAFVWNPFIASLVAAVAWFIADLRRRSDDGSGIAIGLLVVIGVAIGVAVTRYRLYDINQVISRTASYAIVTGLLLLTYVALVTAVTRVVGSQPTWVIAAATLAVAALFRPLLTRVQRVVDRRFNREKYDAQREVDRFSTLLTEVVDADRARSELLDVIRAAQNTPGKPEVRDAYREEALAVLDEALARLRASIQNNNSMKLSFTG